MRIERRGSIKVVFFGLVWVFLLFSIILVAMRPIRSFDPWWHLATGRWIFQHLAIPRVDPFSFTMLGKPWIDLAWLFQILEFVVYEIFGFHGLVALKVVIVLLAFYFLYRLLVFFTENLYLVFGVLLLTLSIAQARFMVRPHLLAFLWVVLFLYLFHLYFNEGRLWQVLLLTVVYVLWVNTHGSFVVAPFLVGVFLFGALLERWRWQVKEITSDPSVRRIGVIFLVVILASLCNPYGFKYVTFALFSHRGMGQEATRYIAEWHRMSFYRLFTFNPLTRIGQIALLFWVTFLLIVVNLFQRNLRAFTHIAIFSLMLYLSLKHGRFAALAGFVLAPSIVCLYSQVADDLSLDFLRVLSLIVLIFPIIFLVFRLVPSRLDSPELGRAVSRNYPHGVVKFIREYDLRGNMFNKYGYGGFLIWNLYPQCRVFIDGRTPTVYPADFYWVYRMVYKDKGLFKDLASEYNINIVIEKSDSSIAKYLAKDNRWRLVFFDEVTTLFLRGDIADKKGISALKYYKPWMDIEKFIEKNKDNMEILSETRKELERVLSVYSTNLKATTDLGILLSEGLKDYSNALDVLKRAVKLDPRSPNAWYNLGLVYKKTKVESKAIECFQRAISINKDFDPALYQLGVLNCKAKKYKEAYSFLSRYVAIVGDRTPPDVYERLGLASFKLLHIKEAIRFFVKSLYLTHDVIKKAKIYVNLGNCYFAIGDWVSAEKNYLHAIKLDKKCKDAYYNLSKTYEKMGEKAKALKYFRMYESLEKG